MMAGMGLAAGLAAGARPVPQQQYAPIYPPQAYQPQGPYQSPGYVQNPGQPAPAVATPLGAPAGPMPNVARAPAFCPNCGTPAAGKFCSNCGQLLGG
jgi:hypothetical protein